MSQVDLPQEEVPTGYPAPECELRWLNTNVVMQ